MKSWLELVSGTEPHTQTDSGLIADWWRFEQDPEATEWKRVGEGNRRVHGATSLTATGRLIGGCIETIANLAGTTYGDVAAFGTEHQDDSLIVYLEASQDEAVLDALGRLNLPIVFDLEIGHVPPHLPLINGALATITVNETTRQITQELR